MRGERQMNKNSQRLEDGASGSPYVNRCGEYGVLCRLWQTDGV